MGFSLNAEAMQKMLVAMIGQAAVFAVMAALFAGSPAPAQTGQSVTLVWDANPDPDIAGYRVYYGTSSGNYTQSIDVGNVTTATISNLVPGQTYYFVVTDYNTAGLESLPSNEVAYTAVAAPAPAVSLSVTPSAGTKFVVPVSIVATASASETGGSIARVEFYGRGNYLGEVTAPPYTFTLNRPPAGEYSLTARAVDDQGVSTTSAPVDVTMTMPPAPRVTK